MGTGGRVGHQQLDPASVDLPGLPLRLREEPLQPCTARHGTVLGADDRFAAGQRSQRLVAVGAAAGLQAGAEAAPLRQPGEQGSNWAA
jgi:hypothetical protein